MKYFQKITGKRIYLSPISMEDTEIYTKWMNDPAITDNLGNSSLLVSLSKERAALEGMEKEGYHFAIVEKETHTLLGNVSLFSVDFLHQKAECGIFIGEEQNRSKGYGKEALTLLIQYGFTTLHLNNIMLRVFSFNKRAQACYQSVGFRAIGSRRQAYFVNGTYADEVFMDILAQDFLADIAEK